MKMLMLMLVLAFAHPQILPNVTERSVTLSDKFKQVMQAL